MLGNIGAASESKRATAHGVINTNLVKVIDQDEPIRKTGGSTKTTEF